jgi:hypothetical protein
MDSSTAFMSSTIDSTHFSSPSRAFRPETRTTGRCRRRSPASEQLTDLELDELQDLLVVDHVALVERDEQVGHADLLGEQHVLTRLRHRAVGGGDHEDRAVHLSGTGDHVLDVVGVTGRVDVRVVALRGLVLDVRDVDRDTTLTLFGSRVDRREVALHVGGRRVLVGEHLRDRSGERGLAVVDVTDRSDVDVRLGPLELGLGHWVLLRTFCRGSGRWIATGALRGCF